MASDQLIIWVVLALGALLALALSLAVIVGAIALFAFAADQGFIGLVAYFAAWFFLFPIMLIGSLAVGAAVGALLAMGITLNLRE